MIRDVVTLQENATAHEAVQLLNKHKIGCIIILSNDRIVGIVTERDLLQRVLEQCKNPRQTRVTDIMTRKIITGTPTMDVFEATRLMFKLKVKKLPITENNRLIGIVTLTDIARATSIDQKTIELIEQLSNMHIIA
jgi:CBS domain-containing protein